MPPDDAAAPEGLAGRKRADTDAPVLPEIEERWSPRAFADRPVSDEVLKALFEAARWAPSSYNEQPWRFVVARKQDAGRFDSLLQCLVPKNREWAKEAPVLMLSIARTRFTHSGEENRHAFHDVGLAMGNLLAQATAEEVAVHQMAGIDADEAARRFDVPDAYEVVAAAALGYRGNPSDLAEGQQEAEVAERDRKPLSELVFGDRFGDPLPL